MEIIGECSEGCLAESKIEDMANNLRRLQNENPSYDRVLYLRAASILRAQKSRMDNWIPAKGS
jgi:hypothetical protein